MAVKKMDAVDAEVQNAGTAVEVGSQAYYAQKVPVKLFKDNGKYRDDVFVAVNGKGWLIKRGVEVEVPRAVAEVLSQSMEQDTRAAELMDREAESFRLESQRRGLD